MAEHRDETAAFLGQSFGPPEKTNCDALVFGGEVGRGYGYIDADWTGP